MDQVSGPVIAVGLVLSAVFVPCAFISGITGQFFRQFALTIAVSTFISAFNSLTLSPALTALLLRPRGKDAAPPLPRLAFALAGGWLGWEFAGPWLLAKVPAVPWVAVAWGEWIWPAAAALAVALLGWCVGGLLNRVLAVLFRGFNAAFTSTTHGYVWLVGRLLRVSVAVLVVYGGLVGLTWFEFNRIPRGFIPDQDMGFLMVTVQLPDSASLDRTDSVARSNRSASVIPGVRCRRHRGQSFMLSIGLEFRVVLYRTEDYPSPRSDRSSNDITNKNAAEIKEAQWACSVLLQRGGPGWWFRDHDRRSRDSGPAAMQSRSTTRAAVPDPGLALLVFRANVPLCTS